MFRLRRRPRWLALLAIGLVALFLLLRPAERIGGGRVYVIDGDSLRVEGRAVRIMGIDSVELRQFCRTADGGQWSCGLDARAALERLARGDVDCRSRGADRYGRALALCGTATSPDLGAALVAQGWAVGSDGQYAAEEASAKAARRGI